MYLIKIFQTWWFSEGYNLFANLFWGHVTFNGRSPPTSDAFTFMVQQNSSFQQDKSRQSGMSCKASEGIVTTFITLFLCSILNALWDGDLHRCKFSGVKDKYFTNPWNGFIRVAKIITKYESFKNCSSKLGITKCKDRLYLACQITQLKAFNWCTQHTS